MLVKVPGHLFIAFVPEKIFPVHCLPYLVHIDRLFLGDPRHTLNTSIVLNNAPNSGFRPLKN